MVDLRKLTSFDYCQWLAFRGRLGIKSAVIFRVAAILALLLSFLPDQAFAVQTHGDAEGYFVHQMAHVVFAAALVFLLYALWRQPIGTGRGWFFFKCSLLFFLLWNVDAFVVHDLEARLPEGALTESGPIWSHRLNPPYSLGKIIFYLGKFDHIFSLPAIIFLVLSLRAFCRKAEQHGPGNDPEHRGA
jgi:hypothetical protein